MSMLESAFNDRNRITVPPGLPIILKRFCKAAIRTQPYDLLKWSSAYFRALAEGEEPPTKMRLEHPLPRTTVSGLTLGFLKVLLRQLGDYNEIASIDAIHRRWDDLCLDRRDLDLVTLIGKFRRKCQVKKFLAVAVGLVGSSLFETMILVCELFTLEPEGGSAVIPVALFIEIYGYLAGLRCDGNKREFVEEDPMELLISDQTQSFPRQLEIQSSSQESNGSSSPFKRLSLASRDTRVDAKPDSESSSSSSSSSSKDESRSYAKHTPEIMGKSSILNGGTSSETEQRFSKTNSQKSGETSTDAAESNELGSEKSSLKSGRASSGKDADERSDDVDATNKKYDESGEIDEKTILDNARKKNPKKDATPMRYYPNVPGIGTRLLPEDVAAVAIWMTECAKLQEGMVGPRNLRHFDCPPLDRQSSSES